MQPLCRDELLEALRELSDRLRGQGLKGHVYVIGGAAMSLAFDAGRITMDIDRRINEGHDAITKTVQEMAAERGWPGSWLNEQASSFIPRTKVERRRTLFQSPNLLITGASPEHLLAIKMHRARPVACPDIAILVSETRIRPPNEAFAIHAALFKDEPLEAEKRRRLELFLDDVCESIRNEEKSVQNPPCG